MSDFGERNDKYDLALMEESLSGYADECEKLRAALAAERETVRALREALRRIAQQRECEELVGQMCDELIECASCDARRALANAKPGETEWVT